MKKYLKIKLEYLIYLFIFLLPFSTRYIFEETIYSLYGLDIIWGLIFIIFLVSKRKEKIKDYNFILLLGFFWLVNFFNLYWAGDKALSGYYLLRLSQGLILSLVILKTQIDFKKISWAWIASASLQSILALIQFTTQKAGACKWLGMAEHLPETLGTQVVAGGWGRILRAYGTFGHPNILGMFLVMAILLTIYLYLKKENKYLLVTALVLESTGLMLTLSRQAWLALGLGLLLILILYKPKKIIAKLITVIFSVGLIFSLIYPEVVLNRFNLDESLEIYSVQQRYEQYQDSGELLKKYWPIGVGLENYTKYQEEPVHNIYVLILAELGMFGIISFLLLIVYTIYTWLKKHGNFWGILLIGILFLGLFDHYLWSLWPANLTIWIILGLFYNYAYQKHSGNN